MKKTLIGAAAVLGMMAPAVQAQDLDEVTLQLKWVTQAQFAGYYVAEAQGFTKRKVSTSRSSRVGRTSRPSRSSRAAAPT